MNLLDSINAQFIKASALKDEAVRTTDQLGVLQEAANEFKSAAREAIRLFKRLHKSKSYGELEIRAYAHYYFAEHYSCLATYEYEKRNVENTKDALTQETRHLSLAIRYAQEWIKIADDETANKLSSHLPVWEFQLRSIDMRLAAIEARGAWDQENFITALDYFRHAAQTAEECFKKAKRNDLDPRYVRIAHGNYIGMMANASSALAMYFIKTGTDGQGGLTADTMCFLVSTTLDAYELGTAAVYTNPEWEQYRRGAEICYNSIKGLLEANPSVWSILLGRLYDDQRLKAIMKEIDHVRTAEVLAYRPHDEPKQIKLWRVGTLWTLLFLLVFGSVYFLAMQDFGIIYLAVLILAIESIFIIIGAFILRSAGGLSEKSFIDLVRMAISKQVESLKALFRKGNGGAAE